MSHLTDRVVIVSGGSSGIGAAVGAMLAEQGASLVLVARGQERLASMAEELRGRGALTAVVAGDLRDHEVADAAVAVALERFGGLHGLVHSAGDAPSGTIEELTDDQWENAFSLKFGGAVRLTRAALPHLRVAGGSIVYVAGGAGLRPGPQHASVGAVNASLINLTVSTALLVAADGVRVNAVAPGPTRTPRWDRLVAAQAAREDSDAAVVEASVEASIPSGQIVSAEEVASVVSWLMSPSAAQVTGATIPVDAGSSVAPPGWS